MKDLKFNLFSFLLACFLVFSFFVIKDEKNDQEKKIYNIGVLEPMNHKALDLIFKGMKDELEKNGYVDGKNIKINLRNANGDQSNLSLMAEKLIDEKNDVLVGITTLSSVTFLNATKDIPIVISGVTFPKESGLVKDEKKSNTNVTGVSDRTDLKKEFQLIKKVMPNIKKIGILFTASEDNAKRQASEMENILKNEKIEVVVNSIMNSNDINQVAQSLSKDVDAIFVPIDNTIASSMTTLTKITDKYKIPVFPSADSMVKDGGLLALGVDQYKIGENTAKIIIKILSGENPGDIPISFEKDCDIFLNEKKAKSLNIKIPQEILKKCKIVN